MKNELKEVIGLTSPILLLLNLTRTHIGDIL